MPQRPRFLPWLAIALLLGGAAVLVVAVTADQTVRQDPVAAASSAFPFHASPADAEPFPITKAPGSYRSPAVRRAYAIAREIPEVLVQQPCLCACAASHGHGSLLDCFVDDHAAT